MVVNSAYIFDLLRLQKKKGVVFMSCKINTDIKSISSNDARLFYNIFYKDIIDYSIQEFANSQSYSFTFKMYMQNEILQYWKDKGYTKGFSNLTLKFVL